MTSAKHHEIVQAFLLYALNEPLHERRGVGGPMGGFVHVESSLFEGFIKAGWELAVPIVHNQVGLQPIGSCVADEGLGLLGDRPVQK